MRAKSSPAVASKEIVLSNSLPSCMSVVALTLSRSARWRCPPRRHQRRLGVMFVCSKTINDVFSQARYHARLARWRYVKQQVRPSCMKMAGQIFKLWFFYSWQGLCGDFCDTLPPQNARGALPVFYLSRKTNRIAGPWWRRGCNVG